MQRNNQLILTISVLRFTFTFQTSPLQETGTWSLGASKHRAFVCGNQPQVQLTPDLYACRLNKGPLREAWLSDGDGAVYRECTKGQGFRDLRKQHTISHIKSLFDPNKSNHQSLQKYYFCVTLKNQFEGIFRGPPPIKQVKTAAINACESGPGHIITSDHLITKTRFSWKYLLVLLSPLQNRIDRAFLLWAAGER